MSTIVTEIKNGVRVVNEAILYGRSWVDVNGFTIERETIRFGTVEYVESLQTTDDTVTSIATIELPETTTLLLTARVIARRTGGTAGTAEDALAYEMKATFKNVSGTATQIGTTTSIMADKDQMGWDVVFNTSSNNVLIDVNGAVDNNVDWLCFYNTHLITTIVPALP